MQKLVLITAKTIHVFLVEPGAVSIVSRPRNQEREFCGVTAKGKDNGENLVLAAREAGLSDGGIAFIAHKLRVVLPDSAGISDIYELRGRANRFSISP